MEWTSGSTHLIDGLGRKLRSPMTFAKTVYHRRLVLVIQWCIQSRCHFGFFLFVVVVVFTS